jgi:uncharacterized membrane protein YjjB (DUF3815 family)
MILASIYTFFAAFGFAVIFNIRGKNLFFAALGGGLGWFLYLLCKNYQIPDLPALFIAAIVVSLYSEVLARLLKTPVTTFIICAILPMVPGNGMYYTMLETIQGNNYQALNLGTDTLIKAGTIALAIAFISSFSKLIIRKKTSG